MSLSAEQHAVRRRGIGSSDIAGVVGVDPFTSPLDVWLDKMGRSEREANVNMRMGNRLEDAIAEEYAEQQSVTLARCDTTIHPEHHWVIATPDRRVVGARKLVECKNVGYMMMRAWEPSEDGAPVKVIVQATWQMYVTGDESCDIVAWLGGRDFRVYPVAYDAGLAASLAQLAQAFWFDHVLTGVEPPVDGRESTRDYLQKMHPQVRGPLLDPSVPADEAATAYRRARADEKAAKARKDTAANQLRALCGDAEGIRGICSWKPGAKGVRTLRVFGTEDD